MIIFLDIDGVIATSKSYNNYSDDLDPQCIDVLNVLTDRTKSKIVISSTWRIEGLVSIQEKLKAAGVKAEIIGVTPSTILDRGRGGEILQWIKDNKYEGSYLVVDDEISDIRDFVDGDKILWVKKGWFNCGLTPRHIRGY